MRLKRLFLGIMLSAGIANIGAANYTPENVSVSLKVPGNDAKHYSLTLRKVQDGVYDCQPSESLPLVITRQVTEKATHQCCHQSLGECVFQLWRADKNRL